MMARLVAYTNYDDISISLIDYRKKWTNSVSQNDVCLDLDYNKCGARKGKRQHVLTLQVSRYNILLLLSRIGVTCINETSIIRHRF